MLLSRHIHRSPAAIAMMAVAAVYVLISTGLEETLPAQGEQGLCLPPPALWDLARWLDVGGGIVLNGLVLAAMWLINKNFNVLRSNTRLHLGLYAVMAAAAPRLVLNVNSGVALALTVNACVWLLFSCYDDPGRVRRVFLAFMLMSLGGAMQYCFVVYIPFMWVIVAQMRVFSLRAVLASVFGLVTPWVIMLGFGLVAPADIHMPHVTGIFTAFAEDSAYYFLAITAFSAFLLVVAMMLNLSRTIAYNARARAFNGALTIMALVTICAIAVNYNNLLAYLPLLNACAAYQITHWFVNHRFERQWIAVTAIWCCYILFYIWRIVL